MLSMTGYGKDEFNENGVSITVEIKSVNNRNFDFNAKMPRSFIQFEDSLRKIVYEYIKRGRIDLFINYSDTRRKDVNLFLDLDKAISYYNASVKIAKETNLENDCSVSYLMKCPDVITDNTLTDCSEFEELIFKTVRNACEKLNVMRKKEGEKLVSDMLMRLDTIKALKNNIGKRAPLVVTEHKTKLKQRIEEALNGVQYDEAKLLSEVTFFTDKANIDEELTRLNSHIEQFKDIVNNPMSGKKLDFLMQEFNRETNTICSKSNDIEITKLALSMKNEIEKIREQVQNIE